jgi:hypothetical protein
MGDVTVFVDSRSMMEVLLGALRHIAASDSTPKLLRKLLPSKSVEIARRAVRLRTVLRPLFKELQSAEKSRFRENSSSIFHKVFHDSVEN